MKFRDPKIGGLLETRQAYNLFCEKQEVRCKFCPISADKTGSGLYCLDYFKEHIDEAALLMGYEVIDEKEAKMEKKDKPRLAEVLGVEVGARFRIKGEASTYFLDKEGIMRFDSTHEKSVSGIYTAINHPESIIRAPRLTEPELAICKAVGAKWVSRDQQEPGLDDESHVVLWWGKPSLSDCGVYANLSGDDTGTLPASLFPSVHPGDCICVEEAGG